MKRRILFANALLLLIAAAAASPLAAHAQAQDYPARNVKIVVAYPPGSGLDTVARLTAERLGRRLKQPFIVENRAGAGGNMGSDFAFKSPPDGYTLLVSPPSPLVINQTLYSKLTYSPDEFIPVSVIASLPNVLVVNPKFPADTVQGVIALAKERGGKLNYASQGAGTTPHLTAEMFRSVAQVDIAHVPYKGVAPALTDLIGGQVDMMFADIASALPYIRAGRLRAIAVASAKRSPLLPNTPTVSETLPGFSSVLWYALVAPPKTPSEIVNTLAVAMAEEMRDPIVTKTLGDLSMDVIANSPAEARAFMRQEAERWGGVIRRARITVE